MKNITEMSKDELTRLQKEVERMRANEAKARDRAERLRVKNQILVNKAKEAGLTATDAEIDAYIKKMKK